MWPGGPRRHHFPFSTLRLADVCLPHALASSRALSNQNRTRTEEGHESASTDEERRVAWCRRGTQNDAETKTIEIVCMLLQTIKSRTISRVDRCGMAQHKGLRHSRERATPEREKSNGTFATSECCRRMARQPNPHKKQRTRHAHIPPSITAVRRERATLRCGADTLGDASQHPQIAPTNLYTTTAEQ